MSLTPLAILGSHLLQALERDSAGSMGQHTPISLPYLSLCKDSANFAIVLVSAVVTLPGRPVWSIITGSAAPEGAQIRTDGILRE